MLQKLVNDLQIFCLYESPVTIHKIGDENSFIQMSRDRNRVDNNPGSFFGKGNSGD